ncbi:MAG: replication-relaxation family protein [Planktomarina sp.]
MTDSNKPLSKYKREPKRVAFQITDRDLEIMRALNRYRYMRTGQIHQLLFSDNGTVQSARRRLRALYHHRYIARAQPYVQVGKPAPEIAYYLDRKGRQLMRKENQTVKYWRKGGEVKYQFLEHALAVSQFRVDLEIAVSQMDDVSLDLFIPDFEMRKQAEEYVGKKRYLLYREATHPANRKSYIVHPDALIVLTVDRNGKKASRMLCLEIDQGTQGLDRIRDKMTGYRLAQQENLLHQFSGLSSFIVLFQANTARRADNIFNALVDHASEDLARVSSRDNISADTIISEPIWKTLAGDLKRIVAPARSV